MTAERLQRDTIGRCPARAQDDVAATHLGSPRARAAPVERLLTELDLRAGMLAGDAPLHPAGKKVRVLARADALRLEPIDRGSEWTEHEFRGQEHAAKHVETNWLADACLDARLRL